MQGALRIIGLLCGALVLILEYSPNVVAECGYEGCPASQRNMINVHLVPHSHDDVGWLKTVDQYYYGSRNGIQHAGVQYILDNVVQELLKDPARRFIYVESAFLFKWFNEQSSTTQKSVKRLIQNGQLEIVGGAWSMNDEAAVHYQSVIDQFSLGLRELSNTFGICARPRIGWQIDPFGHSREMASIFAQMGYDGEFFARMDWVEKNYRLSTLAGEVIWKASDSLGESAELFTGVLFNHYSAPPGFCFDTLCSDAPIIDGNSYDNNVKDKVDTFIAYIHNVQQFYRASDILVPMGDDFNYENADMNFKNMDKLIKYVNARQAEGSDVHVFYSTPGCYLNALHKAQLTWPDKTQDFFPYSSDWHAYWTGYYSSRPTQKRFERDGNHFLQVTKQLTTLANLTGTDHNENLDKLRHAMGVMQHHDAITGTEKQLVAYDYDRLLAEALHGAQLNARAALQKLTNLTSGEFVSCLQLNISLCEFTQQSADNLVVTLFNPLSHASTQYVRVPVQNATYVVTDANGNVVRSQLTPVAKEVVALSFRPNATQYELVFEAEVEKLTNYYVSVDSQSKSYDDDWETISISLAKRFQFRLQNEKADVAAHFHLENFEDTEIIVENSAVKLTFSETGHLVGVQMNNVFQRIRQDFYYYQGAAGNNNERKNRSSGAYIFRPNGTEVLIGSKVDLTIYNGTLVKEVHQRFNDWVSQVIRIYEGVSRVEFEWLIGPIPIDDNIGKEVITRFSSDLASNGVFWTDSNGREMLRRVIDEREYFKPNLTERVSGNYYPVTARIALQDKNVRLALLNDRAQGGTSIKDGTLELMLHRRLLRDDAFGVGEALNETAFGQGLIARGKVQLILGAVDKTPTIFESLAQQEIHLPFWKFFSNATHATNYKPPKLPDFSKMLPYSVQVLTLEPYSDNERLLRLEQFLGGNDTNTVHFNIRSIFDGLGGEEIRETTLDGSLPLSEMKRFKFQPTGSNVRQLEYYTVQYMPLTATKKSSESDFEIALDPMQIRTFIIKWK